MPDSVLLVSLDCVRPESLSYYPDTFDYLMTAPYGAKTPTIDSIAADGLTFTNAFTQAPFTPASHASVFTGTDPYRHGIRSMFGCKLRDDLTTMAEVFRDAGYQTGSFIGAHALSTDYGLDRGFNTYDDEFDDARKNWIVGNRRPRSEVTEKAIEWLETHRSDFFLFLHYFDAHDGGGQAQGDSDSAKEDVRIQEDQSTLAVELYDRFLRGVDNNTGGQIRRLYKSLRGLRDHSSSGRRYQLKQVQKVDKQLSRIVKQLKSSGDYRNTTIVIFADHGDAFGEHGEYGHRDRLYDTTLRVPLIIKPPASVDTATGLQDEVVRLIDIFPTVAEIHGLNAGQASGQDLLSYVVNDVDNLRAYAETRSEKSPALLENPETDYISLRTNKWKLIVDQLSHDHELYDVESDPEELHDVSELHQTVVGELTQELESLTASAPAKIDDIDTTTDRPSVVDQLEGLGYL